MTDNSTFNISKKNGGADKNVNDGSPQQTLSTLPAQEPLVSPLPPVDNGENNDLEIIEASYTVDHLSAVMRPVMLTMFLARYGQKDRQPLFSIQR